MSRANIFAPENAELVGKCVNPIFAFSFNYAAAAILHDAVKYYGTDINVFYPLQVSWQPGPMGSSAKYSGWALEMGDEITFIQKVLSSFEEKLGVKIPIVSYTSDNTIGEKMKELGINYTHHIVKDVFKSLLPESKHELIDQMYSEKVFSSLKGTQELTTLMWGGFVDPQMNVVSLEERGRKTLVTSTNINPIVELYSLGASTRQLIDIFEEGKVFDDRGLDYYPLVSPLRKMTNGEIFELAKDDADLLDTLLLVNDCCYHRIPRCGHCGQCIDRRHNILQSELVDTTTYEYQ